MPAQASKPSRTFKTAWFSKASAKMHITDAELCKAIREVMLGQAVDLGGGVFKKRLNRNLVRSIILARGGQYWVHEFLFAKKDLDNIGDDDLADLRKIAKSYETLTSEQVSRLIETHKWTEICDDRQTQVQK